MVDFRRVVTALAVLALLTGFAVTASAQTPFQCNAQTAVPPLLRAEGVTELIGDIVLVCQGGTPLTAGAGVNYPLANFQTFVGNTTITSRPGEPLLLIDEPTRTGGTNPALLSPVTSGCTATGVCPVGTLGSTVPNTFQGTISGNSVAFLGVPIIAPAPGSTTIYRITNVRVNASAIGSGAGFSGSQVLAFTSISGSTSVLVTNPQQVVGFVQQGLAFQVRKADNSDTSSGLKLQQCVKSNLGDQALTLRYTEGFATAFKVQGSTTGGTSAGQTTVGAVYNTESGLTWGPMTSSGTAALAANEGQADFGTRLRAVFRNIPSGVSVYVSTTNLPAPTTTTPTPSAVLVASEAAANTTINTPFTLTATDTGVTQYIVSKGTASAYKLAVDSTGTATAVWEIIASNPLAVESVDFQVWFAFSSTPANNVPAQGVQATVSGSFAPISTTSSSSSSAPIPRFVDLSTPQNVLIINICRTSLLFPFVTAANGFDTGLAIANTTSDLGTTTPQTGNCVLNFLGDNAPSATAPQSVAGGKVGVWLASAVAPGFQGYVIARCDFQYAHGFAFVQSTVGYTPSSTAMGYLALVLTRLDSAENLNQ